MKRNRIVTACASALAILTPWSSAAAHETSDGPLLHTIQVSGRAKVEVAPDRVTFTAGVETSAAEVATAVEQNNTRLRAVIESLVKEGVDRSRIRTARLSIQPQYDRTPGRKTRIVGYRVDNSVTVRVDDVDTVGKLLQAAINAGANEVGSLSYGVSDAETARVRKAGLENAFADARDKARTLAGRAGRALGPALIIVEGDVPARPRPQPMYARAMEADVSAVPTEPGLQELVFTVSAVFGLE